MDERQPQTGYKLPLNDACALATTKVWRQKVLVYVTRGAAELLVFEHHPGVPEVPAGGVEPGETPDQTAVRETQEESGLRLENPVHLASYHWTREGKSQVWHYYWLQAPASTPDTWIHTVTSSDKDQGETFHYRFAPIHEDSLLKGHRFEAALPELKRRIQQSPL